MNKSIRKVAFAAAVVAVTGYGVYENQSKETLSDVMLENVEALADKELNTKFKIKNSRTWDEGPYWDLSGNRYFFVYSVVECFDDGVVDCEPDASMEIVYK